MRFQYADSRMPVSMTKAGSIYYLTYDQVGSLRAVADSAGNVIKRIDYDSFGNIITDTNTAFTIPFGFAGGLHDRDTGLVRFGFRDYDPDIGRWTAKDPIGFDGGDTDLYGYVLNDPVNAVDPFGLLNPIKMGVGYANSLRGVIGIGAGVVITGAGTATIPFTGPVVATPAYLIGGSKIAMGFANFNRGLGQMHEALYESFAQTSFKNFFGLAPFGQKYDDPCEPSPLEYFEGVYDHYVADPVNAAKQAIRDFFALD